MSRVRASSSARKARWTWLDSVPSAARGGVAERRGNGLQSRVHGFESRLHLSRSNEDEQQSRQGTCSAVRLAHLPDTEGVPSSNLGRCTTDENPWETGGFRRFRDRLRLGNWSDFEGPVSQVVSQAPSVSKTARSPGRSSPPPRSEAAVTSNTAACCDTTGSANGGVGDRVQPARERG